MKKYEEVEANLKRDYETSNGTAGWGKGWFRYSKPEGTASRRMRERERR